MVLLGFCTKKNDNGQDRYVGFVSCSLSPSQRRWSNSQKIANPMMIGWIETLLDFDFDVIHIPGILNKLPDLLSRLYPPIEVDSKLVEDRGLIKKVASK